MTAADDGLLRKAILCNEQQNEVAMNIKTGNRVGSSWFSISRDRLENILSLGHTYCYPWSLWARADLAVVYCQTSFPKITRFRDFFNWSFVYPGCNLKKAPTSLHWELGENEPMRLVVWDKMHRFRVRFAESRLDSLLNLGISIVKDA